MTRRGIPFWVLLIATALASIDPLQHLWLTQIPDELVTLTTEPHFDAQGELEAKTIIEPNPKTYSGFHIGDTPFFLTAMKLFGNDFYSPYVTCEADAHDWRRFALPHHWLYAALGWVATRAEVTHFLALGYANGIGAFLYLIAVWCFLQRWRPAAAPTAFVLFTLGGGLAGVLYLGAYTFGLDTAPGFEAWFHRYARYELIEGPFIAPVLVMPRLYYTLPLALGFTVLTLLLAEMDRIRPFRALMILLLITVTTLLNARLGPFFLFAAFCLLYAKQSAPPERRIGYAVLLAVPVILVGACVSFLFSYNPSGTENVAALLRRAAWFGSVASALFWLWPLIFWALLANVRAMPLLARIPAFAAAGYLIAFAIGYGVHQVYWGNLFAGGDTAAAIAVSDWALLGTVPGALCAAFFGLETQRRPERFVDPDEAATESQSRQTRHVIVTETNTAALLWAFALLAVSISAFGGGAFMQLMPERCLVLLGVPLAVLAADRLLRLADTSALTAGVWLTAIVLSGLLSTVAGALCFQGPYRHSTKADAPFAWLHAEVMPRAAANTLAQIGEGTVLAPADGAPFLGDVAVHQSPNRQTVFGQPSLEFSDRNMMELAAEVQHFYEVFTADTERVAFVKEYCVDWVVATPEHFLGSFLNMDWLELIHEEDGYYLFRVRKDAL